MLYYRLYNNPFTTDDPDDRLARPVDVTMNTRKDLIEDITAPGSILKPTETNAVIDNYWKRIILYLREGEGYTDEYIRTRFGISGIFTSEDDQFEPGRHEILIKLVPKSTVTEIAGDIPVRKLTGGGVTPEIDEVNDWASGTIDEVLTPGDVLEITGSNLKIYDNIEDEGVFFVPQSGDDKTEAPQIHTNEPTTLALRIPEELSPGTYRLEVRNTPRNGNQLRSTIFTPRLIVQ
ncbi:DUF4469 domain-containing protein [Fodinibius sediminis]|uniref:DNA-binding domain-containing protein n=1 Tax=Fodinibius sediminis TaxID=1214077 RepID=A0A521AR34_9BACT|nr:DUF4469 domain-containing protein [Fodinibius sediminis]SMO37236.1 DNA-binding domain-containing protein [Fodinibius sediminis]